MVKRKTQLSSATVGAIHELKVAIDLLERGFQVFRALSPSCECDLALISAGKLFRVEVTTGYTTISGRICSPGPQKMRKDGHKFDVLATVVDGEKIVYEGIPLDAIAVGVHT